MDFRGRVHKLPGVKGRSGGRNRKSVQSHILRGTWRASRHQVATRAATVPAGAALQDPSPDWLAGLGPEGRRFVFALHRDFDMSATEGLLARTAGQAFDEAADARARGDLKAARAATRQALAALQRLQGFAALERS
jgi:hypothetical protein